MEWSDIRIFLQVARHGTLIAATRALGMDHSTISRRIARLEVATGVSLFERAGRRLALTRAGSRLLGAAERLESIVIRDIASLSDEEQHRVQGCVRIGTTEDFGAHYLGARLAELTAEHPMLEVELVALPKSFSLATREVDLVIGLDRPASGNVRIKKLTPVEFGAYGSATYFRDRRRPQSVEELARENWCGYIKELLFTAELDLFPVDTDLPNLRYRSTSATVQLSAARSGYALAILPCFVAAAHGGVERLLPEQASFERTYWLAVHEDLASYGRVRTIIQALERIVQRDRSLFRPSQPGSLENSLATSETQSRPDEQTIFTAPAGTHDASSEFHANDNCFELVG